MPKTIDFGGLLKDLYGTPAPIKENVQERPTPRINGADFSQALGEIFQTETAPSADFSPLQACSLYVFMRSIVMEHFGMGYDYAITDRNGTPLKSWFTIPEAIEVAEKLGYKLTVSEARAHLDQLIGQKYIQTDNIRYRRCAFWDGEMESYLRRFS